VNATSNIQKRLPVFEPKQKAVRMKFCGLQPVGDMWMPLWTPLENINRFEKGALPIPAGSTFSQFTLRGFGIFVPNPTGWKAGQIFDPNLAD